MNLIGVGTRGGTRTRTRAGTRAGTRTRVGLGGTFIRTRFSTFFVLEATCFTDVFTSFPGELFDVEDDLDHNIVCCDDRVTDGGCVDLVGCERDLTEGINAFNELLEHRGLVKIEDSVTIGETGIIDLNDGKTVEEWTDVQLGEESDCRGRDTSILLDEVDRVEDFNSTLGNLGEIWRDWKKEV